ncbi:porin family protein [Hymenobacter nivis]|nr:porin family protein [Hymenobacter nivis]
MKKFLLALLVGTAAAPAARAQADADAPAKPTPLAPAPRPANRTSVGLKAGYSLSSITGDGASALPNADRLPAFHLGAYGQLGLNKFASVQVELLYARRGYRTTLGSPDAYTTRLNYLDLPVLFVGNITPNLSFHVGPQASVLLDVARDGATVPLDSRYQRFALGGVGGLEYRVGNARLGARYNLSFSRLYQQDANVQYNSGAVYLSNNNIYTRSLEVYLGFGIGN